MIALEPRAQKALALAQTSGQWTQLATGAWLIPSQSTPGQSYRVTPQTCSCPAAERQPEQLCKHSLGLILYLTISEMDASPAPSMCTCLGRHTCAQFGGVLVTAREN